MRREPAPDAAAVVLALGGSAHRHEVLRRTTLHSLRRAVAAGTVRRRSHGIYVLPDGPDALAAARAVRGVVSHLKAAEHWLLEPVSPSTTVHVTVPPHARPSTDKRVTVHYTDVAAHEDSGFVTSPSRTVLDCARTLPFEEALAIADCAVRRGLVTTDELVQAADLRRGPGSRQCRRVAAAADGRSANGSESVLRAVLLSGGLTSFVPQLAVQAGDHAFRVDLGDPGRRIAVEADSFAFHGTRAALVRDCFRYDEMVQADWLVLRFAWEHVMAEQAWVLATVTATCRLRDDRTQTRTNRRAEPSGRSSHR